MNATTAPYEYDEALRALTTPDGRTLPVRISRDGTPVVVDPTCRIGGGFPTSVLDLMYEQETGVKLEPGSHVTVDVYGCWVVQTAGEIHAEIHDRPLGGRPYSVDVDTARDIKREYFKLSGVLTKAAQVGDVSTRTARRIVTGEILWYA